MRSWPADPCHVAIRERVGAHVARRVGMATHPVPANAMRCHERIELAPQLGVLDRLAVARSPAVLLPVADPRLDTLLHVLRVEVEVDVARARQRLERADDGGQLHAVVRRERLAAEELLLAPVEYEERAPAARARVALARAAGVDDDRA